MSEISRAALFGKLNSLGYKAIEAATNLFRFLRELDACGLDLIVAERVPDEGLGAAINDRLSRASH